MKMVHFSVIQYVKDHVQIHKKAQTSLLLIYARGPSNLPIQSNKQQWNLRRYDNTPAKKIARRVWNVIPVGIYCLLWFWLKLVTKKCSKLFARQIQSVNKRQSICQEPTPIRRYTRHRRKFGHKGTTFFRYMQEKNDIFFVFILISINYDWRKGTLNVVRRQ